MNLLWGCMVATWMNGASASTHRNTCSAYLTKTAEWLCNHCFLLLFLLLLQLLLPIAAAVVATH
jgi:hypothetical protein